MCIGQGNPAGEAGRHHLFLAPFKMMRKLPSLLLINSMCGVRREGIWHTVDEPDPISQTWITLNIGKFRSRARVKGYRLGSYLECDYRRVNISVCFHK